MFVSLGLLSPFVWSLGYIWIDAMQPQALSYGLLTAVPMSLIMGAGAFICYIVMDRRAAPAISSLQVLCGLLAMWVTLTTFWAVAPNAAWAKWDPNFKAIVFTIFLPFVFRSRVQIEAFLLIIIASTAAHIIPWGFKTLLTGGGYGMSLGLLSSNASILSESSTVSGVSIALIPLLLWIKPHSVLLPWKKPVFLGTSFLIITYLIAALGTFARTGLISIGVLAITMFVRTKRKVLFLFVSTVIFSGLFALTSDKWTARVSTIGDYRNEGSANTRLLVWKWTWDFAKSHPLGGGFSSYVVNVIVDDPGPNGEQNVQFGRAFHNIYVAALGEHGYPGAILYILILISSLASYQRIIRRCKNRPALGWAEDLARAAQLAQLVMMAAATFVDISYSFILWDLIALSMCLNAHVSHVVLEKTKLFDASRARLPQMPQTVGSRPF